MDNSNQHKKNEMKQQLTDTTSPNQSENAIVRGATPEYEDTVFEIVTDCYGLSSQIVTIAETMAKAKDWARLLFNVIPEDRLLKCFNYARNNHNSPYAISAYELESAHRKLYPGRGHYETIESLAKREAEYVQRLRQEKLNAAN